MTEVVDIKRKPQEDVVRSLERLVDDARAGELQGFVLAGVNERGDVITAHAGDRLVFSQIGALEVLKAKLLVESSQMVRECVREVLEK